MKTKYVLIGILLLALAVKVHPPMTSDFFINFDSIYHSRLGQIVADTGWVPSDDYVAGGRPHLYPPLYHLLLGYTSIVTGVLVIDMIGYILPIVTLLFIFTVFFLIKKYRGEELAIFGAAIVAFNPLIMAQSYDSPQLFGFLLFPIMVYLFFRGAYAAVAGLLAVSLLFNFSATLMILAVFAVFSIVKFLKRDRKPLMYTALIAVIGIGLVSPWLLITYSRAGECLDVSTAVSTLTFSGITDLLLIAPFVALLGFGLLYWLRKKNDDYTLIWKAALGLATVGFLVSIFIPQLHPFDQLLLLAFSLSFILPELDLRKNYKVAIVVLLLASSILTVLVMQSVLSSDDVAAVNWIKDNVPAGTILANPEVSGTINTFTMSPAIQTEFDLFLECLPDSTRWSAMYAALSTSDRELAAQTLDKYGVDYVVLGARDVWNYNFDVEKFKKMDFEVVFTSGETLIYKRSS